MPHDCPLEAGPGHWPTGQSIKREREGGGRHRQCQAKAGPGSGQGWLLSAGGSLDLGASSRREAGAGSCREQSLPLHEFHA